MESPTVRLATTADMCSKNNVEAVSGRFRYPHMRKPNDGHPSLSPALLVSYVFLRPFLMNRHRYTYRDWVMDSGAYSAHNSGTNISLRDYIYTCKTLKESDATLSQVFALDVIGDWRNSLKNTERMWREGVEATPCYHYGEPESVLVGIAKDYPRIAVGGVVGVAKKAKMAWISQIFARVWPKKVHGFGMSSEDMVMTFPFHSVDATNWELGPCAFGKWASFGDMSVRGSKQNLRAEVEWHLRLEARARSRWKKEMEILEGVSPDDKAGDPGRFAGIVARCFQMRTTKTCT